MISKKLFAALVVLTIQLPEAIQLQPAQSKEQTSTTAGDALLEPTFVLKDGQQITAGKASCVKTSDGRSFVITVLHLLGPDGGLNQAIPANQVAARLKYATFENCGSHSKYSTNKVLSKTGYLLRSQDPTDLDFSGDIIILEKPTGMPGQPFQLASKIPKEGTTVWLYTRLADGKSPARLYPAVVRDSTNKALAIQLSRPMPFTAMSGSPVLDKEGKIVGLFSGCLEEKGLVLCNPAVSISNHIRTDVRK